MPLNNLLERRFIAAMIPDIVGPHDCDGPGSADLQTIGLGPLDAAAAIGAQGADQPQLLKPFLEKGPGVSPFGAATTFLLVADTAQENLPRNSLAANLVQRGPCLGKVLCVAHSLAMGSALGWIEAGFSHRPNQSNTVLCHCKELAGLSTQ